MFFRFPMNNERRKEDVVNNVVSDLFRIGAQYPRLVSVEECETIWSGVKAKQEYCFLWHTDTYDNCTMQLIITVFDTNWNRVMKGSG